MDTSVETGGTYEYGVYIPKAKADNIGLMNQQTNLLIGFGSRSEANSSGAVRTCPYCAEQVKAQATICRFCQKDLPMLEPNLPNQVAILVDENFENLPQKIIMLRDEGFSYYLIAQDFNESNVAIPNRHSVFEVWSPELVKLVERGN